MRGVVFIAVLLALGIANGQECGFRVQHLYKDDKGRGFACYLNAGHYYKSNSGTADVKMHDLNGLGEYNVFWQCGGGPGPIWYWENGKPGLKKTATGSRMSIMLPNRLGKYRAYYLDRDGNEAGGGLVNKNEYNAKVDQKKYDTPIQFGMYGPSAPDKGVLGVHARKPNKKPLFKLERSQKWRWYDTVAGGARVWGYEARWQSTNVVDRTKGDNFVRILPVICATGKYGNTKWNDVDPISDPYPVSDPYPAYDPNPSGLLIQIPSNINYIQTIFIGVLLVSLMGFCVCTYTRKSPEKIKYKSVKFDSDTDAV